MAAIDRLFIQFNLFLYSLESLHVALQMPIRYARHPQQPDLDFIGISFDFLITMLIEIILDVNGP